MSTNPSITPIDKAQIKQVLSHYQQPSWKRAAWQLLNTLLPYFILWYLMVLSLQVSYLLTLGLAILAAGFMVRTFIIFHDAGHGSFFPTRRANDLVGILTGILTFTPYHQWRHDHAVHHATAGDLDRRGTGDVTTLTVDEYLAMPWWKQAGYRIMRNPLVLFTIGAFLVFAIFHRFPSPGAGRRERNSVIYTDLALIGLSAGMILWIGWQAFLLIIIPVLFFAASAGVWLFYVQHNFEGSYWVRHEQWDFFQVGLRGSSYYQLPAILQWFSGNIGFHHIHHLNARIPNYLLPKCYLENPFLQVKPLTIPSSLRSLRLRFWDEQSQRMVGYEALKSRRSLTQP